MTSLLDLAGRVEALTGPCREMDADIGIAVGLFSEKHGLPGGGWVSRDEHSAVVAAPNFTESLDCAVTLVPERHGFYFRRNCSADGDVIYCNAQVWPFSDPRDDEAPRYWANSPENAPAIALVAACLKARAASEASRGR